MPPDPAGGLLLFRLSSPGPSALIKRSSCPAGWSLVYSQAALPRRYRRKEKKWRETREEDAGIRLSLSLTADAEQKAPLMGELRAPQERRGLGLVGENIPEVKAQLQTSFIWMPPRRPRGWLYHPPWICIEAASLDSYVY
ncbi:unnamed protein product [Rangifer tarandus platyrhynchus]|uniref:Uncharacterized protein n=2 Tax=Rangifer tarandus platyrhynchus TaxID=3082113 RepID=A0ACB0F5C2_RANTA|nr:unnamed protein product [Rangifer tarandus platyrhynchus]CAI9708278.1 unnamed protein product [Rangifer tarandus platyrhynchus]